MRTAGPRIVLVMGVSGSGKSTVGKALADALGAEFLEGDDFHPPANVQKMSRGEPLTDEDREPWLDRMHEALWDRAQAGRDAVLACSALKEAYRERLLRDLPAEPCVVHLHAACETLLTRMRSRDHFMPPSLLASQFETLEPPGDALTLDATQPVDRLVEQIVSALNA